MFKTSLSQVFSVLALVAGIGTAPAIAQNAGAVPAAQEHDIPVRQGIASDGTQLREDMESVPPMHGAIAEMPHQHRLARSGANKSGMEASAETTAYQDRDRVICEHRRSVAAAEWQCKPHARQR
ncbi:MAG: hypothetical protein ACO1NO_05615 [Burkholderiaceae bacterium]